MELHHGRDREELRNPLRGVYQFVPEYAYTGRGHWVHFRHRGDATL